MYEGIKVTALAGGVGGAKLAQGLAEICVPGSLHVIVNTGDDFELLGLKISPDLDTVLYTLAGLADPKTGWGIAGDTYSFMQALEKIDGPTWFKLGDRDLATHVMRSHLLAQGKRLTEATQNLSSSLGVKHVILPMCDEAFRTKVLTEEGLMDFQDYFVARAWQPRVKEIAYHGLEKAKPSQEVLTALQEADMIVFCPSNPYVSIDPILSLPEVRRLVAGKTTVAVSPILGGKAVKGPAAKMMQEFEGEVSAVAVAKHYQGVIKGLVLDEVDASLVSQVEALGITADAFPTMMPDLDSRIDVAKQVLEFGLRLMGRDIERDAT